MTDIAAINASPKSTDSATKALIRQIGGMTGGEIRVTQALQLLGDENREAALAGLLRADALLIAFPLYVDALPAPLVKVLTLLERAAFGAGKLPKMYALVNCGFYEAGHNQIALDIVENFCARAGLPWGYGLGIGSGGFAVQDKNMAKGPAANVYAALRELADAMLRGGDGQNRFATPRIPRFVYKLGGNMMWYRMSKKNGVRRDLGARPHL